MADHVGLGMSLDDLIKKQDKPAGGPGRGKGRDTGLGATGGVQKILGGAKVEGRGRSSAGALLSGRGRGGPGRGSIIGGRGAGRGGGDQGWIRDGTGFPQMPPVPVLMHQPVQPDRQSLVTIQKLQAAIAQKDLVISQQQTMITQLQQQLMHAGTGGGQRHVQQPIAVEEPIEEPDPNIWRGLTCLQAEETGDVEVAYRWVVPRSLNEEVDVMGCINLCKHNRISFLVQWYSDLMTRDAFLKGGGHHDSQPGRGSHLDVRRVV